MWNFATSWLMFIVRYATSFPSAYWNTGTAQVGKIVGAIKEHTKKVMPLLNEYNKLVSKLPLSLDNELSLTQMKKEQLSSLNLTDQFWDLDHLECREKWAIDPALWLSMKALGWIYKGGRGGQYSDWWGRKVCQCISFSSKLCEGTSTDCLRRMHGAFITVRGWRAIILHVTSRHYCKADLKKTLSFS